MSKAEQEALTLISFLIQNGCIIQIEKKSSQYEITIWPNKSSRDDKHYQGSSLVEAIMKAGV